MTDTKIDHGNKIVTGNLKVLGTIHGNPTVQSSVNKGETEKTVTTPDTYEEDAETKITFHTEVAQNVLILTTIPFKNTHTAVVNAKAKIQLDGVDIDGSEEIVTVEISGYGLINHTLLVPNVSAGSHTLSILWTTGNTLCTLQANRFLIVLGTA